MAKIIHVSVAVLSKNNQFLLCSRPIDKGYSGYWEFPGGKIEPNETSEDALVRELYEELNILVNKENLELLFLMQHVYEDKIVNLHIFKCTNWQGNVSANEGQSMYWQQYDKVCDLAPQLPTTIKIIQLLTKA
jgi:8-oxo-dGTP diphosphatase